MFTPASAIALASLSKTPPGAPGMVSWPKSLPAEVRMIEESPDCRLVGPATPIVPEALLVMP